MSDTPETDALVRLSEDCYKRAKQCLKYAHQHRRDGRQMSEQFHRGAEMAFTETAERIRQCADDLAALRRGQHETNVDARSVEPVNAPAPQRAVTDTKGF